MTYLSAVQTKNILAKYGIAKGKKSNYSSGSRDGAVATLISDGWLQVGYNNPALARESKVELVTHNSEAINLIHFILKDRNKFEFRGEAGFNYYRKAI